MNTLTQRKEEIEKGCECEIDVIPREDGCGDVIICGEECIRIADNQNVKRYCPTCQARLEEIKSRISETLK